MVELEAPCGVEMQVQASRGACRQGGDPRSEWSTSTASSGRSGTSSRRSGSLKEEQRPIEVLYQVRNVLNGIVVRTDEAGAERMRGFPA